VKKTLLLSILRGKSHRDWNAIGRIANLAVSELVPDGDKWRAEHLLIVPPPVRLVNEAIASAADALKTQA
jgi:hypothetical protein